VTRSIKVVLLAVVVAITLSCQNMHFIPANGNPVETSPSNPNAFTAASCSYADVSDCINGTGANTCRLPGGSTGTHKAKDGDTVYIPAGACTWTTTLVVNTAIDLLGSATVIIDNLDMSTCIEHPAIFMNVAANLPWRLSNLTIQGESSDTLRCSESIKALTNSHAFRIDHITFNNMQTTGISVDGDAWGVIDHSVFNGDERRGVLIQHSTWGQVGGWGDNSWAQPDTMGTNQAVFVEDSVFNITNAESVGSVACQGGGRCVARYNSLQFLGTHGTDSDLRVRSTRHFEVYGNVITDDGTIVGQAMQSRGGTTLFFNNSIVPTVGSYSGILALEIYREVDSWTSWGPPTNGYLGGCDGTGPFDNNDGRVYDSGTYNGNSGREDTLTDNTKNWTMNQWIGYSLHNATTGPWGASIQSNTANTITTYKSSMGAAHTWNAGDKYQIFKVYPCLDQVGRGAGDYISGGGNAMPASPAVWPQQQIDPVYAWNNRLKGTLVPAIGYYYTHSQANRDYYDWTANFDGTSGIGQGVLSARPATCTPLTGYWATDTGTLYQCATPNTWTAYYTPYTYPHPLTLATSP
jgi:hypothetical protein